MSRVKRGTTKLKRRKNVLAQVKGYRFDRGNKEKTAKVAIAHAGTHAFRDRKTKKRIARATWSLRINAAVRTSGLSYSKVIGDFKKANIGLDRKVLSTLAKDYPEIFARVLTHVQK